MAYAINRANVSFDTAISIRSMLCLQPKSFHSKYNRDVVPDPILFYSIENEMIHLPYLFAASLLQITPNMDIVYLPTPLVFTGVLRQNQVAVEQEAWNQLEMYGTSTLGLYPGFGKTILGAKLASRAKLMTVILVHRDILTTQWKKTFEDHTNARVWIVGEKYPPATCDVIICMDTRWDAIPLFMRDNCGFLIIDEVHAFCTPTRVGCLLAFHPKYILLESGSLERDDEMHVMAYAIAGKHGVFRESSKPFSVMKICTNTKPIRKMNRMGGVDYISLVNTTLMDPRRNQIILELVLRNIGFKILILTALKEHAMLLYEALRQMNVSCDFLCGTKRSYQDSNVLIGTTSKIGTGFDPANLCTTYDGRPFDLLFVVSSIKKYSMLIQNIGRVFRADFPTVMHLVDNDDIFKSHWYKSRKWYLARGGIITDCNIPNNGDTRGQNIVPSDTAMASDIISSQKTWTQNKIAETHKKMSLSVMSTVSSTSPVNKTSPENKLPVITPLRNPVISLKVEPMTGQPILPGVSKNPLISGDSIMSNNPVINGNYTTQRNPVIPGISVNSVNTKIAMNVSSTSTTSTTTSTTTTTRNTSPTTTNASPTTTRNTSPTTINTSTYIFPGKIIIPEYPYSLTSEYPTIPVIIQNSVTTENVIIEDNAISETPKALEIPEIPETHETPKTIEISETPETPKTSEISESEVFTLPKKIIIPDYPISSDYQIIPDSFMSPRISTPYSMSSSSQGSGISKKTKTVKTKTTPKTTKPATVNTKTATVSKISGMSNIAKNSSTAGYPIIPGRSIVSINSINTQISGSVAKK